MIYVLHAGFVYTRFYDYHIWPAYFTASSNTKGPDLFLSEHRLQSYFFLYYRPVQLKEILLFYIINLPHQGLVTAL